MFNDVLDDGAVDLFRIDEMGHAEAFAPFLAGGVDVDADDHVGAREAQALDHVQADPAQAEDHGLGADLDLGGVDDRPDAVVTPQPM